MYKAPDTFTNAPPSCNIVNQLLTKKRVKQEEEKKTIRKMEVLQLWNCRKRQYHRNKSNKNGGIPTNARFFYVPN